MKDTMRESSGKNITRRQLFGVMASTGVAVVGAGLLGACSASRGADSGGAASSASQGGGSSSAASSSAGASSPASSFASAQTSSSPARNGAIVVVFSWSGNTMKVADRVAENLRSELFRIEPATPYTENYDEMLQIAQDEQAAGTLPAIAGGVDGWEGYSTVYLGFPTWWGHLPQIVKSFLADHDCAGKVIRPFNTHGGSGFASCLSDLAEACPAADIREGLSLLGDNAASSAGQIDAWVAQGA